MDAFFVVVVVLAVLLVGGAALLALRRLTRKMEPANTAGETTDPGEH